jgi:DNA-binding MarR family transcriptional regulator
MEDSAGSSPTLAATLAADLRALVGKFRRRLREQASAGDLTPSQISALLRLEKEGKATMSGLARAEAMRPQSMAALIAPLEAAGFLRGEPDPDDKRQTILSLTDSFRQRIKENRAVKEDWLAGRIRQHLSADEQQQLAASIEFLHRLIQD